MVFFRLKFWGLRKQLSPNKEFKNQLWQKLALNWDKQKLPRYRFLESPLSRRLAGALAGFVLVATSITNAYAYVSPDVTEDTPLYPVKKVIEHVVARTKFSPQAKANFLMNQISRRNAEAVVLKKRKANLGNIEAKIERTEDELKTVSDSLTSNTQFVDLKAKVKAVLEKRQKRLEDKINKLEDQKKKIWSNKNSQN